MSSSSKTSLMLYRPVVASRLVGGVDAGLVEVLQHGKPSAHAGTHEKHLAGSADQLPGVLAAFVFAEVTWLGMFIVDRQVQRPSWRKYQLS